MNALCRMAVFVAPSAWVESARDCRAKLAPVSVDPRGKGVGPQPCLLLLWGFAWDCCPAPSRRHRGALGGYPLV